MAILRISSQDATGTGSTQNANATYSNATKLGNLLIAAICAQDATGGATTITAGGAWTNIITQTMAARFRVSLYYKSALGNEKTITAHNSNASTISLDIFEYTNNTNPIVIDGFAGSNLSSGSVTTLTGPNINSFSANNLVLLVAASGTIATKTLWNTSATIGANLAATDGSLFCGETIGASNMFNDTADFGVNAGLGFVIVGASFQGISSNTPPQSLPKRTRLIQASRPIRATRLTANINHKSVTRRTI